MESIGPLMTAFWGTRPSLIPNATVAATFKRAHYRRGAPSMRRPTFLAACPDIADAARWLSALSDTLRADDAGASWQLFRLPNNFPHLIRI